MNKYTVEFKLKGGSWKIFQADNLKYKNVEKLSLNDVMPEIYKNDTPEGMKFRILKDGKIWKTFENGVEKITLNVPTIEEDEIEAEMKKQRKRTKKEFKTLGWK